MNPSSQSSLRFLVVFFLVLVSGLVVRQADAQSWGISGPDVALTGIPFDVKLDISRDSLALSFYEVVVDGQSYAVTLTDDDEVVAEGVLSEVSGATSITLLRQGVLVASRDIHKLPPWTSILPPLMAIVIALIFKRVVPALFLGIWLGAFLAIGISFEGVFTGLFAAFQVYVLNALANPDHASIILFTFMIGGMVGIISRNGGMQGVVNQIVKWAKTAVKGQVATAGLGVAIFFDDYANTLVVGNTMRPVTDRLRISREKLAYLVDSTAAPVACIALVTTWIGYEVGLIGTAVANLDGLDESAYALFLASIPYSFYPVLAIAFVFMVSLTRLDFGPMYAAELRARTTGEVMSPGSLATETGVDADETAPKEGVPHRMINAVLPVVVLVVGVMVGLYVTGDGDNLRDIIGSANSYKALMWASLLGVLVAAVLSVSQRILTVTEVMESWYSGLKGMLFAMIILVLAWSLSSITDVLQTADFLVSVLGDTVSPSFIPAIVFLLSAATAFATGSSWGTMGILLPLVLPLAWAVMVVNDMVAVHDYHILYSTISCVLAGSVWGDHCSPISDTTILSSMASGCDHIEHVRTQLPYALMVGGVALLLGTIPAGFGLPWWVSMLGGGIVLFAILRTVGRKADDAPVTA
ncbi:MAG: Na+/H+ antiporter NhaC family protein [Rhodothermales bacterium]